MQTKAKSTDRMVGQVEKNQKTENNALGGGAFYVECYDKNGDLKWSDVAKNMVVNTGLQDMNTKYFTGSAYTATWYLGLVNSAGFTAYAAGDTLALHTGWAETTDYSGANRPTATFGTATTAAPSVISNSASQAQFNITGSVTVKGAFLCNVQDKTSSTGLLFSVASFEAPGDRVVVSGDTLNVTYQFSLNDA